MQAKFRSLSEQDISSIKQYGLNFSVAQNMADKDVIALAKSEYAKLTNQPLASIDNELNIISLDDKTSVTQNPEFLGELTDNSIQDGINLAILGTPVFFIISNMGHWALTALLPSGTNGEVQTIYMNSAYGAGAEGHYSGKFVGLDSCLAIVTEINKRRLKNDQVRALIKPSHIFLEPTQQILNNCGSVTGFNLAGIAAWYKGGSVGELEIYLGRLEYNKILAKREKTNFEHYVKDRFRDIVSDNHENAVPLSISSYPIVPLQKLTIDVKQYNDMIERINFDKAVCETFLIYQIDEYDTKQQRAMFGFYKQRKAVFTQNVNKDEESEEVGKGGEVSTHLNSNSGSITDELVTSTHQPTDLVNWLREEIGRFISSWTQVRKVDYSKIVQLVKHARDIQKEKFEALQNRYYSESTTDLVVKVHYEWHKAICVVQDWDPSWDPSLDDVDITAIIDGLVDDELKNEKRDRNDLSDEEITEYYKKVKADHYDDLSEAWEDAKDWAMQDVESDLYTVIHKLEPEVRQVILDTADYDVLGVKKEQLESLLSVVTNVTDFEEPVTGYLDDIVRELEEGFAKTSLELIKVCNKELTDVSLRNLRSQPDMDVLNTRYIRAITEENHLEVQRIRIACIQAVMQITTAHINNVQANLEPYITDFNNYHSYLLVENSKITRVPPKHSLTESLPDVSIHEYHKYLQQMENFYKIFPAHSSAKTITYNSQRNPGTKTALETLEPVFAAMRKKGQQAYVVFARHVYQLELKQKTKKFYSLVKDIMSSKLELVRREEKLGELGKAENDKLLDTNLSTKDRKKIYRDSEKLKKPLSRDIEAMKKRIGNLEHSIEELTVKISKIQRMLATDEVALVESTNMIIPTMLFCVSTKPHIVKGDHSRKFFKVDLKPEWLPYLISTDQDDGIFAEHGTQVDKIKHEDDNFFRLIGDRKDLYTWETYQTLEASVDTTEQKLQSLRRLTGHSERVLTQALRTKEVIQYIAHALKAKMESEEYEFTHNSPYKVYGVALLFHSTQIVCFRCVRALIAQQASHEDGSFLEMLTAELNSSGFFKAYRKGELKPDNSGRHGLRSGTIVISDRPYDEELQSKLVREFPTTEVEFSEQRVDLKSFNPLCMLELFKPTLTPYKFSTSSWVGSSAFLSGSLGGSKLVTTEEKNHYPDIDNGIFPPVVKARKEALSTAIKERFNNNEQGRESLLERRVVDKWRKFVENRKSRECQTKEFS